MTGLGVVELYVTRVCAVELCRDGVSVVRECVVELCSDGFVLQVYVVEVCV